MESAVLHERHDRTDRGGAGHHHNDRTEADGHQRRGGGRKQRNVETAGRATDGRGNGRRARREDEHLESALAAENLDPVHRSGHPTHR